jgi:hypothetical protein
MRAELLEYENTPAMFREVRRRFVRLEDVTEGLRNVVDRGNKVNHKDLVWGRSGQLYWEQRTSSTLLASRKSGFVMDSVKNLRNLSYSILETAVHQSLRVCDLIT